MGRRSRGVPRRAFLWALAAACFAGGRGGVPVIRPLDHALIRRMARWAG